MVVDTKRVATMKKLVKDAKKSDAITPSEKVFALHPPGGIWQKDENGKITIKEASLT